MNASPGREECVADSYSITGIAAGAWPLDCLQARTTRNTRSAARTATNRDAPAAA